jgi:hypothetical protein
MPGWERYHDLVRNEFSQCLEEGREPAAIEALRPEYVAAGDDEARLLTVWDKLVSVPMRKDFPFDEPSDLPGIQARRPSGIRRVKLSYGDEVLYDRLYGAWLARSAGCALGKPVECFMVPRDTLSSKDRVKQYLLGIGTREWPLNNYIPAHSPAEDKTGKVNCPLSTREQIKFMESDDDIRYTVIGQLILQDCGKTFNTLDVMKCWMDRLPYKWVCTAETQAYRNAAARYGFHCELPWNKPTAELEKNIDWNWVATHQNPYREWIGAQIRADSFGYAAPGDMELAADFAWRDARMSHIKNGIYGEMFVAAMIAAAFVYDNPLQIIQAGLNEIPATSRLYAEMNQTIEICRRHNNNPASFEAVLDEIYKLLGHYSCVHTNNNAALVVASLLLGGHDLEKVLAISVMGGWDTDCNGATAGSIAGAMLGAKALPHKWIDPLHDTLNSQIIDYHPIAISECARRSLAIAKKTLA